MGKYFKEWTREMKIEYGYDPDIAGKGWRRLQEDWIVSTKQNCTYHQRAFHICYESWKAGDPEQGSSENTILQLDEACKCGEVLPEGVRMVALLLEAL